MRNFQQIASGLIVTPLLNAVLRNDLWNKNTLRTQHPNTAHSQVDDIWLRFNKLPENVTDVIDDTEAVNYPAWFALPDAQNICLNLMHQVRGERLGRVLITRLAPGKTIDPHVDGGAPANYYRRFHVSLLGMPGQLFRCGSEIVSMPTGEVWWVNNRILHSVENNSADDRVTMIVDIRCCE